MSSAPPPSPQRTPIIVLSVVGTLLILAVVGILITFAVRIGGEAPLAPLGPPQTAPPAPPSPHPSSEQPTGTEGRFTFFSAGTEVQCPLDESRPAIEFSWETENAAEVWYSAKDTDTIDDTALPLPLDGDQDDLAGEHVFPCADDEYHDYTVTLVGVDGGQVNEHFRVIDLNWNGGTLNEDE